MNEKYDWIDKYNEIAQAYAKESDRAAAVLIASFLEDVMAGKLRAILVDDKKVAKLFDGYGPLATFAGKIDMAFALGLLTPGMETDLNLIRKVRNHFAHSPRVTDFGDARVKSWCADLSVTRMPGLKVRDARGQYIGAIAISLVYFDRFVAAEERRRVPDKPPTERV